MYPIQVKSVATSYQVFSIQSKISLGKPHQGAGHHVPQRGTWEIIASGIYLQASVSWCFLPVDPAFSEMMTFLAMQGVSLSFLQGVFSPSHMID